MAIRSPRMGSGRPTALNIWTRRRGPPVPRGAPAHCSCEFQVNSADPRQRWVLPIWPASLKSSGQANTEDIHVVTRSKRTH